MNKMKFNKEIKTRKNQIETLELKNTTITLKISTGHFTSALSQTEERSGDFEDKSFKSIPSEEQKKEKKIQKDESLWENGTPSHGTIFALWEFQKGKGTIKRNCFKR